MAADRPRAGTWVLAIVGAVLGALLLTATPAGAHAVLQSSAPADDATVTEELTEVVLTFSEPVELPQVVVADPGGRDVTVGAAVAEGDDVRIDLDDLTEMGTYTIAYRVTSDDGHPISGELEFTYEGPLAGAEDEVVEADPTEPAGTVVETEDAPATEDAAPATAEPVPTEETAVQGDDGSSFPVLLAIGIALIAALAGAAFAALRRRPQE